MFKSFQNCVQVFLSCSNRLGKGPHQVVGLKSCCNSLIHVLDQRSGLWRAKHHFDIGIKNTKKNRGCLGTLSTVSKIIKDLINLTVLLHFTDLATNSRRHLIAPVVYWQYVLTEVLEGPGVLTVSHRSGFHLQPATLPPSKTYPVLKSLETWHWLGLRMAESLFMHPFPDREISSIWNICSGK